MAAKWDGRIPHGVAKGTTLACGVYTTHGGGGGGGRAVGSHRGLQANSQPGSYGLRNSLWWPQGIPWPAAATSCPPPLLQTLPNCFPRSPAQPVLGTREPSLQLHFSVPSCPPFSWGQLVPPLGDSARDLSVPKLSSVVMLPRVSQGGLMERVWGVRWEVAMRDLLPGPAGILPPRPKLTLLQSRPPGG